MVSRTGLRNGELWRAKPLTKAPSSPRRKRVRSSAAPSDVAAPWRRTHSLPLRHRSCWTKRSEATCSVRTVTAASPEAAPRAARSGIRRLEVEVPQTDHRRRRSPGQHPTERRSPGNLPTAIHPRFGLAARLGDLPAAAAAHPDSVRRLHPADPLAHLPKRDGARGLRAGARAHPRGRARACARAVRVSFRAQNEARGSGQFRRRTVRAPGGAA